MGQKWVQILLISVLCQQMASGAQSEEDSEKVVKEGTDVEIACQLDDPGTMVVWFRVVDKPRMEFIGSFSPSGTQKAVQNNYRSKFSERNIGFKFFLKLKSFVKDRDSGMYTCASIYRGVELRFGKVTRLRGEENEKANKAPPTLPATTQEPRATTASCACPAATRPGWKSFSMFCEPIILGPLVGSCGLLLLLLFITIIYCNRIRTRRCPHHYKRKPRMVPHEKQMANTHM